MIKKTMLDDLGVDPNSKVYTGLKLDGEGNLTYQTQLTLDSAEDYLKAFLGVFNGYRLTDNKSQVK